MMSNFMRLVFRRSKLPLARGSTLPQGNGLQPVSCRNVLLVEYRDEVFARLATTSTYRVRKCGKKPLGHMDDGSGMNGCEKLRLKRENLNHVLKSMVEQPLAGVP